MGLFTTRCQVCGKAVSRRARYCSDCGTIPEGSNQTDHCWRCRKEVAVTSSVCPHCQADLTTGRPPEVSGNQWLRREDEFAVRVEVEDVPGFLKRELYIETGTRAAFILDGQLSGEAGPGWYMVGGILNRIPGLSSARRMTAVLVNSWDTELEFVSSNVYTRDPIGLTVTLSMVVAPVDVAAIKGALLQDKRSLTHGDLHRILAGQVGQIVKGFVRRYTAQELDTRDDIRPQLEAALAQGMAQTFRSSGLGFKSVKTIDFYHTELDEITKKHEKFFLQVASGRADLQGAKSLFDVKNDEEIEEIRQQSARLENIGKKIDVWGGMLDATQRADRKVLSNEAEFRSFVREIDKEEILAGYDMSNLEKTVASRELQDEEKRGHILSMLKLEQYVERERYRLAQRNAMEDEKANHEFEQARKGLFRRVELNQVSVDAALQEMTKKTDAMIEERRKKGAVAREETVADARTSAESKTIAAAADLDIKQKTEAQDLATLKALADLDAEIGRREVELEEARLAGAQARELELKRQELESKKQMLEALRSSGADLSETTIAAVAGVAGDALKAVVEALKIEKMQSMTPEQIAAMAAEKNPAALKDLGDVLNSRNPEVVQLLGRMLLEQKDQSAKSQEALERLMKLAMETQRDTAVGTRGGQGTTVVVPGATGGTHVIGTHPAYGDVAQAKTCPRCRATVDAGLSICPKCDKPMNREN